MRLVAAALLALASAGVTAGAAHADGDADIVYDRIYFACMTDLSRQAAADPDAAHVYCVETAAELAAEIGD